jgi:hypothetical protein
MSFSCFEELDIFILLKLGSPPRGGLEKHFRLKKPDFISYEILKTVSGSRTGIRSRDPGSGPSVGKIA